MKSHAKINVFLKIVGKKDNYHELSSRFIKLNDFYDELFLIPKKLAKEIDKKNLYDVDFIKNTNTINGVEITKSNEIIQDKILDKYYLINENLISNFYAPNSIFDKVLSLIPEQIAKNFYDNYALFLHKNIPTFSGLGGASSNAACFIKLLRTLGDFDIYKVGARSGADVSFFLSEYEAANVGGYGEIISEFVDDKLDIELFFSRPCSTKDVFYEFSKNAIYYNNDELSHQKSKDLLKNYSNYFLNDLLTPCENLYPDIKNLIKDGLFLSGSGGTFFKIKDEN